MITKLRFLFELSHAHKIARRYFVTNGFDGVLTMLGLLIGFRLSGTTSLGIIIGACSGAAIALFMSGLTSAYISESAEKEVELQELKGSMLTTMDDSAHAEAAKLIPILIAAVNGFSPLLLSLVVMTPLLLGYHNITFILSPVDLSITIAMTLSFMLGVFLGYISGKNWAWTGIRALLISITTTGIIIATNQMLTS